MSGEAAFPPPLWGRVGRGGGKSELDGSGERASATTTLDPFISALYAVDPHPQPLPARGREWV
jgi:hypothetical protein